MARYRNSSRGAQARVGRSVEAVRKGVPDGKARCAACDSVTSLTTSGRLRKHRTPRGEPCPNIISGNGFKLDVIPEVVIVPRGRPKSARVPRPASEPSRLDAGTGCRECGKWLPGERSLCGACYVKQEASRR